MKNKIFYFLFLSVFVVTSCDDDSQEDELLESSSVSVDVDEVTLFDTPFDMNLTMSNLGVSSVNISGGVAINEDLTVSDKKASTSFEASDFGDVWAVDSTLTFKSTIDFGTHNSVIDHTISVVDAISVDQESSSIFEFDSLANNLSFECKTMFNGLGDILVERKVITQADPNSVFVTLNSDIAEGTYTFEDSVFGVDFNLTDTIVYKITATSSVKSESKEIKLAVQSKSLTEDVEAVLSLTNDTVVFTADSVASVSFNNVNNPRGFQSSNVEFVKIEVGNQVEEISDLNDFSNLVKVVDESTSVGSVEGVYIGDTYAFKYMAHGNYNYGFLTITEVLSIKDMHDSENSVEFTYYQGVKYLK